MSATTAQVSFAAEFVTMLVAASGLVLAARGSAISDRSRATQALLGAGFAVLGVGAFLHGSLILASDPSVGLAASRLIGVGLLGVATRHWDAARSARLVLAAGLALVAAAAVLEIVTANIAVGDAFLVAGALAIGVPLVIAGRRSIATRIAVGSAATLLLVLVVVSVAMSQVISSSITSQNLELLAQRSNSEGDQLSGAAQTALVQARLGAANLALAAATRDPSPLVVLGNAGASRGSPQAEVTTLLDNLRQLYPVGGFVYALAGGNLAVTSTGLGAATKTVVGQMSSLLAPSCSDTGRARLLVANPQVLAIGSHPECATGSQLLGTLFSITPLDKGYLAGRRHADRRVSLALVVPDRVLASSGPQPAASALTAAAGRAERTGGSSVRTVGNHFVSAQPVAGSPGLSMVASTSTASLVSTRERLFRTLFLIALGSTLAALALAVLVGERITAGVRRLTEVAGRIQAGQGSERAGELGTDEVGMLGAAFDSMIDSVEDHAAALQVAADDETRLRNRLEAVVAGINDSLVAVDVDGRIIEMNAAAEAFFGVDAAVVRGEAVQSVIVGKAEDGGSLADRVGRISDSSWSQLARVWAGETAEVPVAISAGAVRGPAGELIGAVLVLRDLRSEQELERMKSEFLARVGHELRSPLTGIMGYSDILLRRDVDPERARVWHREILAGAKQLLRIVEMLEFFASSGGDQVRLRPQPLDPRSLVAGVAAKWNERLDVTHRLVRRIDPETPAILGDRRWLVLLLDELIDNAVKFSPDGGRISLVVGSTGPGARSNGRSGPGRPALVEISIIDEGEGMTAEQQEAAFGEFAQVDASDTRRFGGLGLGLPLVQRVAEGHGGTVTCRSAVGLGTTFVVTLPVAASSAGDAEARILHPGRPQP